MDDNYQLIFAVVFSLVLLTVQRAEQKYRKRVLFLFVVFVGVPMAYLALIRDAGDAFRDGLIIALVFNFLFWLLIGRYNPVGSSDEAIQVLGMDD